MASKKSKNDTLPLNPEKIIDIDVSREMRGSFWNTPIQLFIHVLFQMQEMV